MVWIPIVSSAKNICRFWNIHDWPVCRWFGMPDLGGPFMTKFLSCSRMGWNSHEAHCFRFEAEEGHVIDNWLYEAPSFSLSIGALPQCLCDRLWFSLRLSPMFWLSPMHFLSFLSSLSLETPPFVRSPSRFVYAHRHRPDVQTVRRSVV